MAQKKQVVPFAGPPMAARVRQYKESQGGVSKKVGNYRAVVDTNATDGALQYDYVNQKSDPGEGNRNSSFHPTSGRWLGLK